MGGPGDTMRIEEFAKAEIVNKKDKVKNAGTNDNYTQRQRREPEEPPIDSDPDAGPGPNGMVDGAVRSGGPA